MICTVNSQLLAAELRLLKNVVPTKPAIAILSHALLRAEGDRLHLYATDLEVGFAADCASQVDMPGEICLPLGKFLALVEQFPDADVSIAVEKNRVAVRCGAFKSMLQSMPVKDYPRPAAVDGIASSVDAVGLRTLIARVRPAVSANSSKFVLKGALFTIAGPVAAMVATDGKRLVLTTMSVAEGTSEQRVVIPAKALDLLAGQVDLGDVELTAGRQLQFIAGGKTITTRTIDGEFPKYERIIPRENVNVATIDRTALTAALKRVCVAAEENGAIRMNFSPGQLELSSASAEVGSANEVVSAEYGGPPLNVCINGDYVLDFLGAASSSAITLALKDANGAALFSDGDDHVCVIMLMRS